MKYVFIFLALLVFFSYRLSQVPSGLTLDEAAFGYNAVLLGNDLHDENGRFLPVFVLSLDGKDWRQPVTQYFITAYFKLFGASVYNLKVTSVVIAAISGILIFILGDKLIGKRGGCLTLLFFVTTPILMIHSHLGLDNIMPIPFVIVWILSLLMYDKTKNKMYLLFSAIGLGIGFYSYKGMRSFVPVWSVLTVIYLSKSFLSKRTKTEFKKIYKSVLFFVIAISPFYLIIPFLEYKYAGAVLGQSGAGVKSIYAFLVSYLASFDPSFLYITGDTIAHHSTGIHGMLLLASIPFFVLGITSILKSSGLSKMNDFWYLILSAFFLGPLLFGFPGSIHRASRLMAFIPLYALICGLGAAWLYSTRKLKFVFLTLLILVGINYYDFVNYYWYQYPKDTYHIFNQTNLGEAYKKLSEVSKSEGLMPYVSGDLEKEGGSTEKFLRSIYFIEPLPVASEILPEKSIVLSTNPSLFGKTPVKVDTKEGNYYLYK